MGTAKAWFEVGTLEPILLEDATQVEDLLDRMEADSREAEVPVAATIELPAEGRPLVMQFGVHPGERLGFVGLITAEGSIISTGGAESGDTVMYDYTGSECPIEADAEIDLAAVRRVVHRFVAGAGARDDTITWRAVRA